MAMRRIQSLVGEFAECVMAQKESLRVGNPTQGNLFAERYMAAWDVLRREGDRGREALSVLLSDSRDDVRGMAAACLLRFRTKQALLVLRELANGQGLAAFAASQTLERWAELSDKKRWGLDPA